MKKIPIHSRAGVACFATIDDADYNRLILFRWNLKGGRYAVRYRKKADGGGGVLMHREIIGTDKGKDVDHVDGDGLNNQRENLRECTTSQNLMNRHRPSGHGSSGFLGVHWRARAGQWRAVATKEGRMYFFGSSKSKEEAAILRAHGAVHLFGEFAPDFDRKLASLHPCPELTQWLRYQRVRARITGDNP
jgi:HNH endonuclease